MRPAQPRYQFLRNLLKTWIETTPIFQFLLTVISILTFIAIGASAYLLLRPSLNAASIMFMVFSALLVSVFSIAMPLCLFEVLSKFCNRMLILLSDSETNEAQLDEEFGVSDSASDDDVARLGSGASIVSEPMQTVPVTESQAAILTFADRLKEIDFEGEIPKEYCCPISLSIMTNPVLLIDGQNSSGGMEAKNYDESSVLALMSSGYTTSPQSRVLFASFFAERHRKHPYIHNQPLREKIEAFVVSLEKEYIATIAP